MLSIIVALIALLCIFYYFFFEKTTTQPITIAQKEPQKKPVEIIKVEQKIEKQKINYGQVFIFYGTQTGTAAKMSQALSIQAEQKGFKPQIIDLKDITKQMFNNKIPTVFLLSNTGQGQPPDNTVRFMKILQGKDPQQFDFNGLKYTVFGLGNTQYQFYNKIGKDVDRLLQKNGGKRIYEIGLGDNNASLQDDFCEWKVKLWKALQNSSFISTQNVLKQKKIQKKQQKKQQQKAKNNLASWHFVKTEQQQFVIGTKFHQRYDLQFLTKNYLNSQLSQIKDRRQVRQNTEDGSSLHVEFELKGNKNYKTAGNLAIYPQNDNKLIQSVIKYFKLDTQSLFDVKIEKKTKLNFCTPIKFSTLLKNYVDLQHPINKNILKNLGKLPSKNPKYFIDNSSPKTTPQYTRLTKQFTYIFKLVQQYQIDLTFQTFIMLSNAIAPRLFTIASSPLARQNVEIVDSLQQNGLCSKFLKNHLNKQARVQIRQSSFNDAMKLQKVIFISAGTGYAPFRGYLQQKQLLLKQNKPAPLVSLFFGCKHENGDFIYKDQINKWIEIGVINKFYPAFSRDNEKKVYVQDLLRQNMQQLKQLFAFQNSGLYYCGSTGMGKCINEQIISYFKNVEGKSQQQAKNIVKKHQQQFKIIKQLW